jgi:putative endonuclease
MGEKRPPSSSTPGSILPTAEKSTPGWCVYVLRCRGYYLYTGSTNNLIRRLGEHENGSGSKFVRSRRPFELVKVIPCKTETEARRMEYLLKRLKRRAKIELLCLEEPFSVDTWREGLP